MWKSCFFFVEAFVWCVIVLECQRTLAVDTGDVNNGKGVLNIGKSWTGNGDSETSGDTKVHLSTGSGQHRVDVQRTPENQLHVHSQHSNEDARIHVSANGKTNTLGPGQAFPRPEVFPMSSGSKSTADKVEISRGREAKVLESAAKAGRDVLKPRVFEQTESTIPALQGTGLKQPVLDKTVKAHQFNSKDSQGLIWNKVDDNLLAMAIKNHNKASLSESDASTEKRSIFDDRHTHIHVESANDKRHSHRRQKRSTGGQSIHILSVSNDKNQPEHHSNTEPVKIYNGHFGKPTVDPGSYTIQKTTKKHNYHFNVHPKHHTYVDVDSTKSEHNIVHSTNRDSKSHQVHVSVSSYPHSNTVWNSAISGNLSQSSSQSSASYYPYKSASQNSQTQSSGEASVPYNSYQSAEDPSSSETEPFSSEAPISQGSDMPNPSPEEYPSYQGSDTPTVNVAVSHNKVNNTQHVKVSISNPVSEYHPSHPLHPSNLHRLPKSHPLHPSNLHKLHPSDPLHPANWHKLHPLHPLHPANLHKLHHSHPLHPANLHKLHPSHPLHPANLHKLHPSHPLHPANLHKLPPSHPLHPANLHKLPPSHPLHPANLHKLHPSHPLHPANLHKLHPSHPLHPANLHKLPPSHPLHPANLHKLPRSHPLHPANFHKLHPSHPLHPANLHKLPPSHPLHPANFHKLPPSHPLHPANLRKLPRSHPFHPENLHKLHRSHPLHPSNLQQLHPDYLKFFKSSPREDLPASSAQNLLPQPMYPVPVGAPQVHIIISNQPPSPQIPYHSTPQNAWPPQVSSHLQMQPEVSQVVLDKLQEMMQTKFNEKAAWTSWMGWSPCSKSCGPGGYHIRRRHCIALSGHSCPGYGVQRSGCSHNPPCSSDSETSGDTKVHLSTGSGQHRVDVQRTPDNQLHVQSQHSNEDARIHVSANGKTNTLGPAHPHVSLKSSLHAHRSSPRVHHPHGTHNAAPYIPHTVHYNPHTDAHQNSQRTHVEVNNSPSGLHARQDSQRTHVEVNQNPSGLHAKQNSQQAHVKVNHNPSGVHVSVQQAPTIHNNVQYPGVDPHTGASYHTMSKPHTGPTYQQNSGPYASQSNYRPRSQYRSRSNYGQQGQSYAQSSQFGHQQYSPVHQGSGLYHSQSGSYHQKSAHHSSYPSRTHHYTANSHYGSSSQSGRLHHGYQQGYPSHQSGGSHHASVPHHGPQSSYYAKPHHKPQWQSSPHSSSLQHSSSPHGSSSSRHEFESQRGHISHIKHKRYFEGHYEIIRFDRDDTFHFEVRNKSTIGRPPFHHSGKSLELTLKSSDVTSRDTSSQWPSVIKNKLDIDYQLSRDVYDSMLNLIRQLYNSHSSYIDGTSWTSWTGWSACSKTCREKGTSASTRHCVFLYGRSCQGNGLRKKECVGNSDCAPVESTWKQWGSWNSCSKPCGGGIHWRSRVCEVGTNKGNCAGDSVQTEPCNTSPCHTMKSRLKIVSDNANRRDGDDARHRGLIKSNLKNAITNLDGEWSQWSAWSGCPVTCGVGVEQRTRSCRDDLNAEQFKCQGEASETKHCIRETCQKANTVAPVIVAEGGFAKLECRYNRLSAVKQIYWITPAGGKIVDNEFTHRFQIHGAHLIVLEAMSADEGTYHCVVEHTNGVTETGDDNLVIQTCKKHNPCKNGATCIEVAETSERPFFHFVCKCPPGFTGSVCEHKRPSSTFLLMIALVFVVLLSLVVGAFCWCFNCRKGNGIMTGLGVGGSPNRWRNEQSNYYEEDPVDQFRGFQNDLRFSVQTRDINSRLSGQEYKRGEYVSEAYDRQESPRGRFSQNIQNIPPGGPPRTSYYREPLPASYPGMRVKNSNGSNAKYGSEDIDMGLQQHYSGPPMINQQMTMDAQNDNERYFQKDRPVSMGYDYEQQNNFDPEALGYTVSAQNARYAISESQNRSQHREEILNDESLKKFISPNRVVSPRRSGQQAPNETPPFFPPEQQMYGQPYSNEVVHGGVEQPMDIISSNQTRRASTKRRLSAFKPALSNSPTEVQHLRQQQQAEAFYDQVITATEDDSQWETERNETDIEYQSSVQDEPAQTQTMPSMLEVKRKRRILKSHEPDDSNFNENRKTHISNLQISKGSMPPYHNISKPTSTASVNIDANRNTSAQRMSQNINIHQPVINSSQNSESPQKLNVSAEDYIAIISGMGGTSPNKKTDQSGPSVTKIPHELKDQTRPKTGLQLLQHKNEQPLNLRLPSWDQISDCDSSSYPADRSTVADVIRGNNNMSNNVQHNSDLIDLSNEGFDGTACPKYSGVSLIHDES